ncbi:precorrin-3B synthase [Pseudonocardia tropica]|uniref:Precorrin-3B synthase n=1 Tax=Pseudonocardia tropica TaxID=681289 RepID=A0ABV1JWT2_9PSEU
MPSPTTRTRTDACPGVVSPHAAADGALARVRLPGGTVTAAALRAVAALARDAGDGAVHLTSRGNVQLRGLDPADPRPVQRLTVAGLLPSTTHERVRNVLASPLSGIDGGLADVRGLATALDRGLCARSALSALPGRFLFALDDGRGDVAAERPDLCWRARGSDGGELVVAGAPTGLSCSPAEAPALLLDAAEAFLDLRAAHSADPAARAWRAAELPGAATGIPARLRGHRASRPAGPGHRETTPEAPGDTTPEAPGDTAPAAPGPVLVGALGSGALGVAPVLGELSAGQLDLLAEEAPELLVSPWRTLVLPTPATGAAARLAAAGLVVDPGHPALRVSACAGSPGCAKSLADVRADARSLVRRGGPDLPTHVVGCTRRCGAPHTPHIDAVATGADTYRIDGRTGVLR